MKYCENCGRQIKDDNKFCSYCGTPQNKNNESKKISIDKTYIFSGDIVGKSMVTIDNDKIIIDRKGLLSTISKGLTGKKSIRISEITGTQYKKAGVTIGYLQFIIKGSQEVKGGINVARQDENTICWASKKQNQYAEEIIEYINQFNNNDVSTNSTTIIKNDEEYDKLIKLKELLDNKIIDEEEFKNEKEKILNQ